MNVIGLTKNAAREIARLEEDERRAQEKGDWERADRIRHKIIAIRDRAKIWVRSIS